MDDGVHGSELWKSDGTSAGTSLAFDIEPGPTGSSVDDLIVVDEQVFFTAENANTGRELWKFPVSTKPTGITLSNSAVKENSPIKTIVGKFSAVDSDSGDSFSYSFISGPGDSNNAKFAITGNTLSTNTALDYETKASYSVRVRVTDQGGLTFDKVFTIKVTDVIGDREIIGTSKNDAFVLTFSSTATTGTVSISRSIDGGAAVKLGTFPMTAQLILKGLGGTDSVRVIGTSGNDRYSLSGSSRLTINGTLLILDSMEAKTLSGAAGNDLYQFDADTALGVYTLDESGGGIDTVDLSMTTTSGVVVNLGSATQQVVNGNLSLKLSSAAEFEKAMGGSGKDTLTGNSLANTLTGNAGDDSLSGGGGDDSLVGGTGDDTYLFFNATVAQADTVTEAANAGTDTLSFSTLTTDIILSLGTTAVQTVHANRTLKLNSVAVFENLAGGSGNDTLTGNSLANILIGDAGSDTLNGSGGRDILIGGLGLDKLNGGEGEDIVIAGRTTSDALFSNLNRLHVEWVSVRSYSTRISNLRGGVGAPAVSLKAKVNVLNDAGDNDSLNGGNGRDWYFRAIDDVITGLIAGEILDIL